MNTALIVAAGTSSRAQLNQSKILYPILQKPLFMYSVEVFLELGYAIVLVVSRNDLAEIKKQVDDRITLVLGGKTRSESVMNGLKEVKTPYVFIHDAARPLISKQAVHEIEKALAIYDAVLLAEHVTSALKKYNNNELSSVDRREHLLAQTPQAFLTEKIRYAYLRNDKTFDDDIALYQQFYPEEKIFVCLNTDPNIKVTYKEDLDYVRQVLGKDSTMRIGHSFDIHQLVFDRTLILGGIKIPFEKGLKGHSDADVLLHVIAEAMLGALGLGDLGTYYPDTDPKHRNMDSMKMLLEIYDLVGQKGYQVGNIDATVYAEQPKLNSYIQEIKHHIASHLKVRDEDVSIKATTYEKLDSVGQQKAIAAEAVVLLKKV
ncbi:MAG: 2-C-methyl-D-erythritol 2,4-cyclodiphosphate synthase [Acholeplasmataceae bacterium]|nr:2-C-methyl-D-erythritol 2,4-cyclodiphosphate synthase [Acholeplasmataceae bacterium]